MEKAHLVSLMSGAVLSLFIASAHASAATEWINVSRDYAAGESVGGWQVLEYKDAVPYNANHIWTVNGESGGYIDVDGSSVLWIYNPGSYATVEFSQPSTSVAFMLHSDANDGLANFYVDNKEVLHHYDMKTLPGTVMDTNVGTLVVSGLDYGPHSIKIAIPPEFVFRNDIHMYGGAAVSSVPAPAAIWLWLAGCGVFALSGIRRKISL